MKRLSIWIAMVLVSACVSQRDYVGAPDTRSALVALSPASLGRDLVVSQLVVGELHGEGKSVRFELDVNSDRLVLVALTPTGVPLFSMIQTAREIKIEHMLPRSSLLSPEFLIADIKFAYWPVERINSAVGPFRSRVEEYDANGIRHRVLKDELGQVIVEAIFPPQGAQTEVLVLRRYDIPYRLQIQTLSELEGTSS